MQQLTQCFEVTLLQDVILNATAATTGGQTALDYLPGSVFLGAIAGQIYAELSAEDAWLLFHSGEFRFMDALPLVGQTPSWPIPFSWHHYKGEGVTQQKGKLDPAKIFDPVLPGGNPEPQRQPKQMRQGYITSFGDWVKPAMSQRMKTAIHQDTARAAESQLFGYQSLDAGQHYYFELHAPAVQQELFDKVVDKLSGQLRLGRSRSAQYGQVNITPLPKLAASPVSVSEPEFLTLWLLADLALTNKKGQPCLQPEADLLGLPTGSKWLAEKSFIRTRSYSAFNAHRRCYDPERQVISRGSVLRYSLSEPLSSEQLASLTAVGSFQELGLGRIACNPSLLAHAKPVFTSAKNDSEVIMSAASSRQTDTTIADSVLIRVLKTRIASMETSKESSEHAEIIFGELLVALALARSWKGIHNHQPLDAPSRSQWGRIKELASQFRHDPAMLWQKLVTNKDALLRDRSGWGLEISPTQKLYQVLTAETKDKNGLLVPFKADPKLADIVGRLAVLGLTKPWQDAVNGGEKNVSEVVQ